MHKSVIETSVPHYITKEISYRNPGPPGKNWIIVAPAHTIMLLDRDRGDQLSLAPAKPLMLDITCVNHPSWATYRY
jgi:hypothetical protein